MSGPVVGWTLRVWGTLRKGFDAEFRRSVEVSAFGAVGDGLADDTAAIQAAVDALPCGAGTVWLAGVYRTTSTIHLPPGVHLAHGEPAVGR